MFIRVLGDRFVINELDFVESSSNEIISTGFIGFSARNIDEGFPSLWGIYRFPSALREERFDSRGYLTDVLWGSMLRCSHDSRRIYVRRNIRESVAHRHLFHSASRGNGKF